MAQDREKSWLRTATAIKDALGIGSENIALVTGGSADQDALMEAFDESVTDIQLPKATIRLELPEKQERLPSDALATEKSKVAQLIRNSQSKKEELKSGLEGIETSLRQATESLRGSSAGEGGRGLAIRKQRELKKEAELLTSTIEVENAILAYLEELYSFYEKDELLAELEATQQTFYKASRDDLEAGAERVNLAIINLAKDIKAANQRLKTAKDNLQRVQDELDELNDAPRLIAELNALIEGEEEEKRQKENEKRQKENEFDTKAKALRAIEETKEEKEITRVMADIAEGDTEIAQLRAEYTGLAVAAQADMSKSKDAAAKANEIQLHESTRSGKREGLAATLKTALGKDDTDTTLLADLITEYNTINDRKIADRETFQANIRELENAIIKLDGEIKTLNTSLPVLKEKSTSLEAKQVEAGLRDLLNQGIADATRNVREQTEAVAKLKGERKGQEDLESKLNRLLSMTDDERRSEQIAFESNKLSPAREAVEQLSAEVDKNLELAQSAVDEHCRLRMTDPDVRERLFLERLTQFVRELARAQVRVILGAGKAESGNLDELIRNLQTELINLRRRSVMQVRILVSLLAAALVLIGVDIFGGNNREMVFMDGGTISVSATDPEPTPEPMPEQTATPAPVPTSTPATTPTPPAPTPEPTTSPTPEPTAVQTPARPQPIPSETTAPTPTPEKKKRRGSL